MDLLSVQVNDADLHHLSALALAHIGDGVFELMCRTYLAVHGKETNHSLHRATVAMVSANAQAAAAERMAPLFTEEERDVYRRGRNAKVHAVPHASTPGQYHAATALETLFGYLYLKGRHERLNELFAAGLEENHGS